MHETNLGITDLRFWVKDGAVVGPHVAKATEVIVAPGEKITVELDADHLAFLQKTGHIAKPE